MRFTRFTVLAALLTLSSSAVHAVGSQCNPPMGYFLICGARCGLPGSCDMIANPTAYCAVTFDGYGCHDGLDDPCCYVGTGF